MEGAQYEAEIRYLRRVNQRVDEWRTRYGRPPDRAVLANIERGTRAEVGAAPTDGPSPVPTGPADTARHEEFVDLSVKLWRLEFEIEHGREPTPNEVQGATNTAESTAYLAQSADESLLPFEGDASTPPPFDRAYETAKEIHARLRDWRMGHDGAAPDPDTLTEIEVAVRQDVDRTAHGRPLPALTKQQAAARSDDFVNWTIETWTTEFESRNGRPPSDAELGNAKANIDFEAASTWSIENYPEPSSAGPSVPPAGDPVEMDAGTTPPAARSPLALVGGVVAVLVIAAAIVLGRGSTPGGVGAVGSSSPSAGVAVTAAPSASNVAVVESQAVPSPSPIAQSPSPEGDLCALIGGGHAGTLLGSPVTMVSSPSQCTITPAQPVKIDHVTYAQVVVTINTTGKPDSTSKYAAFGTKGSYGVTASSNSSFDPATGATPKPLLQQFVDLVLAGLP
ncbi:MAG: hypothetical protein ACHQNA_12280 [Acidimicrobiales bacterium]